MDGIHDLGGIHGFGAIERIDSTAYLTQGYYGRWLGGIETLLVEAGVITQDELTRRAIALGADPHARIAARPNPAAPGVGQRPTQWGTPRPLPGLRRFEIGDPVRTAVHADAHHTRLPRYARGRRGVIQAWHDGCLPGQRGAGRGRRPAAPVHRVLHGHGTLGSPGGCEPAGATGSLRTLSATRWASAMTSHDHDSPPALRAEALEALLIERGLLYADAVDAVIAQFEERVGPLNGARVVARAWVDPGFRAELLADGTRAWPCWSRRSRAGGAANLSLFPSGP